MQQSAMTTDMSDAARRAAFDHFSRTLRDEGVRAALNYLLLLTDYRFIGIFRFHDGKATAAVHVDREQPDVLRSAEVPDTATYCSFVRAERGAFSTADAMNDARLTTHPARAAVAAYCGIPVMDAEGELLGTLCVYDLVPRDPAQVDLELMIEAASTLAQGGHVPPYPDSAESAPA